MIILAPTLKYLREHMHSLDMKEIEVSEATEENRSIYDYFQVSTHS